MDLVYKASRDSEGEPYVKGPSNGCEGSYYGGMLSPESRWESDELARKAEYLMNMAYKQGYKKAQFDIRKAIGWEST